ncbi:hypothetical protein ACFL43_01405 [Thermodesulfobacteriota bacterium]
MKLADYGFAVQKIGEYNYNYTYQGTEVDHRIEEYYQQENETRIVVVEKETRRGDNFIRLPQTLWITRAGYPPLSTDGVLQKIDGSLLTLFFAGLPTVQSAAHIRIFDEALRGELQALGLDYDQLSGMVKSGQLFKGSTITGFVCPKKGVHDKELIETLQDRVLKSYARVLDAEPCACPVEQWADMIMGPQADFEYHLFKKWGFDVPLAAQRAFFTIMVGPRVSYLNTNEELQKLEAIAAMAT